MARSKKYEENLRRIQNVLDDKHDGKIQSGYTPENITHKVGDIWTDSDGVKWEQKNGYRSKIGSTGNVGLFSHQCKDCGKNCDVDRDKRHMDTWKRSKRCFYCQLDFEILLKSKPIGKQGLTKWHFWVHLQELQRWDSRWKEIEHWVLQTSDEEKRLWRS